MNKHSQRVAKVFLATLVALFASIASAQQWEIRHMLNAVSTPSINLTVTKESQTRTVDTIRRSWAVRVVAVTDRLAPAFGMASPKLFIVQQASPNAFVTFYEEQPTLVVNTELLKLVGDDDDLMAAVLGHELGHLKANHLTEGQTKAAVVSVLGVLAGIAVDYNQARHGVNTDGAGVKLGALGGNLVNAKFSRDQEREADNIGIRSMASVGFDPNAVPRLWRLMEGKGGDGSGLWLSSHPSHDERLQAMQTAATTVPVNQAARLAAVAPGRVNDPFPRSEYSNFALTAAEAAAQPAGVYRRALEANKDGRFIEALALFKEASDVSRDERAMSFVGSFFATGKGVVKDPLKAYEYHQRSASKGFAPSIFALGDCAQFGLGRSVDYAEALHMYSVADSRGVPRATTRLSFMYMNGTGVKTNTELARELAQKAADKGDPLGKAVLGMMLRDAVGGPSDWSKSFELLSHITDSSLGYANYQLAISYDVGIGTDVDKIKAAEFYRKALTGGVAAAKPRLAALGFSE